MLNGGKMKLLTIKKGVSEKTSILNSFTDLKNTFTRVKQNDDASDILPKDSWVDITLFSQWAFVRTRTRRGWYSKSHSVSLRRGCIPASLGACGVLLCGCHSSESAGRSTRLEIQTASRHWLFRAQWVSHNRGGSGAFQSHRMATEHPHFFKMFFVKSLTGPRDSWPHGYPVWGCFVSTYSSGHKANPYGFPCHLWKPWSLKLILLVSSLKFHFER